MLTVSVARSSSDGNARRYVLPVLWMTSCFHNHIIEGIGQNQRQRVCFVQFARWRHLGKFCRLWLHLVWLISTWFHVTVLQLVTLLNRSCRTLNTRVMNGLTCDLPGERPTKRWPDHITEWCSCSLSQTVCVTTNWKEWTEITDLDGHKNNKFEVKSNEWYKGHTWKRSVKQTHTHTRAHAHSS